MKPREVILSLLVRGVAIVLDFFSVQRPILTLVPEPKMLTHMPLVCGTGAFIGGVLSWWWRSAKKDGHAGYKLPAIGTIVASLLTMAFYFLAQHFWNEQGGYSLHTARVAVELIWLCFGFVLSTMVAFWLCVGGDLASLGK